MTLGQSDDSSALTLWLLTCAAELAESSCSSSSCSRPRIYGDLQSNMRVTQDHEYI